MTALSRSGTWGWLAKEWRKRFSASIGIPNLSLLLNFSPRKNQWSQWPVRTIGYLCGTCPCKTKKLTLRFQTSCCLYTKGSKRLNRSVSTQFTTRCWQQLQSMQWICLSQLWRCLRRRTGRREIGRTWPVLQFGSHSWTNFWVGWSCSDERCYYVIGH